MKLNFTLHIAASKEKIWPFYADLNQWTILEEDLESISLEGGFVTGSKGVIKLAGTPELNFELTKIIPQQSFWDKTILPMGA